MAASSVKQLLPYFFTIYLIFPIVFGREDSFSEELFIKPLDTGHVYTHFQFTTEWDVDLTDKTQFQHFHLFPKVLGEVLAAYSVQELHLSLTQGLWKYDKWGYPVRSAPPGAELWVWFQEGTPHVDDTWTDLINVLSGMFCASLNFMDATVTVSPMFSFRPQGVSTEWYSRRPGKLVKYAALPRENVCTENLTPWKKLLPCSAKAGIAYLFNAIRLYDSSYHSLSIDYRPVCQNSNCTEKSVELSQSMSAVFEPVLLSDGKQDWSLKKLFGRQLGNSCPLASTSKIYVDITSNKSLVYFFKLSPEPDGHVEVERGGVKSRYAVYDIPHQMTLAPVLNIAAHYNSILDYQKPDPPLLHVHRYQTGFGQEKGGIACLLYNNDNKDMIVSYIETIPWFLRVYFHTLKIEYFTTMEAGDNGTRLRPSEHYYNPGRDRQRPYQLEVIIRLPANTITRLSIQFERALLKWTEYPPDANHGFYVNSAVVSALLSSADKYTSAPQESSKISAIFTDKSKLFFLRLHTESLLVTLPTPDFSMPYNVICLACTVVAIAFGSIHNLTTRRFVVLDPTKKRGLLAKIKGFFSRRKVSTKALAETKDKSNKDSPTSTQSDEKTKDDPDRETVVSEGSSKEQGGKKKGKKQSKKED